MGSMNSAVPFIATLEARLQACVPGMSFLAHEDSSSSSPHHNSISETIILNHYTIFSAVQGTMIILALTGSLPRQA